MVLTDTSSRNDGQLLGNEDFVEMVENLGDAFETVEKMYGMIWWLADIAQLSELRQLLGGLEQQASSLTERADEAERAHQQGVGQLQRWRQELAEALASPGENRQELADQIHRLLDATGPDRDSE